MGRVNRREEGWEKGGRGMGEGWEKDGRGEKERGGSLKSAAPASWAMLCLALHRSSATIRDGVVDQGSLTLTSRVLSSQSRSTSLRLRSGALGWACGNEGKEGR